MTLFTSKITALLIFALCVFCESAIASHIAGGGFTYQYLGDTTASGMTYGKYRVSLELYQDCTTGQPEAIAQDNPAFFTIWGNNTNSPYGYDTAVFYNIATAISIPPGYASSCGITTAPELSGVCILRKEFTKTYYLPADVGSYTFVYQRCCRNASLVNLVNPGEAGVTFFCTIPAATTTRNSSAVFKTTPPTVLCLNKSITINYSATDADGDSLSYEFSPSYVGATDADIKPIIANKPPYAAVIYTPPLSATNPVNSASPIQIDPQTGQISMTPDKVGRYLVNVACNEWRNGALINTTRREFIWTVLDCDAFQSAYHPDAGSDHTVTVGDSLTFSGSSGVTYAWSPATFLSDPNIANPVGHFTKAGVFTYNLEATSDSGCTGSDKITITVLDHSDFAVPNAFTPNGDGLNDFLMAYPIGQSTLKSFEVYNRPGNLVYSWNPYINGWDGTCNGKKQEFGVYIWQLSYEDNTGKIRYKSGNVTLLR
jgi:gliding motility-associated-like protein